MLRGGCVERGGVERGVCSQKTRTGVNTWRTTSAALTPTKRHTTIDIKLYIYV